MDLNHPNYDVTFEGRLSPMFDEIKRVTGVQCVYTNQLYYNPPRKQDGARLNFSINSINFEQKIKPDPNRGAAGFSIAMVLNFIASADDVYKSLEFAMKVMTWFESNGRNWMNDHGIAYRSISNIQNVEYELPTMRVQGLRFECTLSMGRYIENLYEATEIDNIDWGGQEQP